MPPCCLLLLSPSIPFFLSCFPSPSSSSQVCMREILRQKSHPPGCSKTPHFWHLKRVRKPTLWGPLECWLQATAPARSDAAVRGCWNEQHLCLSHMEGGGQAGLSIGRQSWTPEVHGFLEGLLEILCKMYMHGWKIQGFHRFPKGYNGQKRWRLAWSISDILRPCAVPPHILRPCAVSLKPFLLNLPVWLEWRAKFTVLPSSQCLDAGKGLVSESMKQEILQYPVPTFPHLTSVFIYRKEERDLCFVLLWPLKGIFQEYHHTSYTNMKGTSIKDYI